MPQFHYLQKGKKACIHPEGLAGVAGMQPELSSRRPPHPWRNLLLALKSFLGLPGAPQTFLRSRLSSNCSAPLGIFLTGGPAPLSCCSWSIVHGAREVSCGKGKGHFPLLISDAERRGRGEGSRCPTPAAHVLEKNVLRETVFGTCSSDLCLTGRQSWPSKEEAEETPWKWQRSPKWSPALKGGMPALRQTFLLEGTLTPLLLRLMCDFSTESTWEEPHFESISESHKLS